MNTSVFVGISVDGFMARRNHHLDFLPADGGEAHGYIEFFQSIDAMLIGRNTYAVVRSFGQWPYGNTPVFVWTHGELATPPDGATVERVEGDASTVAAQLTARGFQHLYVDGGAVIQQFLRAGLIQRLIITRVPVLIGSGISLFGAIDHDIALEHIVTRAFQSGLVQSEYKLVTNKSA